MPVIGEHEELTRLSQDELRDLKEFALANQTDGQGNYRPVLELKNNRLYAQNYVGIIETHKGTVVEILPKVDFVEDDDTEKPRPNRFFLLCCGVGVGSNRWRSLMKVTSTLCGVSICWRYLSICF